MEKTSEENLYKINLNIFIEHMITFPEKWVSLINETSEDNLSLNFVTERRYIIYFLIWKKHNAKKYSQDKIFSKSIQDASSKIQRSFKNFDIEILERKKYKKYTFQADYEYNSYITKYLQNNKNVKNFRTEYKSFLGTYDFYFEIGDKKIILEIDGQVHLKKSKSMNYATNFRNIIYTLRGFTLIILEVQSINQIFRSGLIFEKMNTIIEQVSMSKQNEYYLFADFINNTNQNKND